MANLSYVDLLDECDGFAYFNSYEEEQQGLQEWYQFRLQGVQAILGYIPAEIANRFPLNQHWVRDDTGRVLTFDPQDGPSDLFSEAAFDHRNQILAAYLQDLREKKVFEVLAGWRSEVYPIFGPGRQLLMSMERSATPLFGVLTYGIHMTAYVRTPEGLKIWTPKRSETKQTYPGMMDNTVAGGLSTGENPFECMLREAMEEASLPEAVCKTAKPCGALTYITLRGAKAGGEIGVAQPECEYIYDLELPNDVIPMPNDDEAVDFQALTIDEVKKYLALGKFKPNCASVVIDFFVRHGILTPENEPDYLEIVSRLHRRLPFPTM